MFGFELICTFCKGLGKLAVIPGIGYMKTCKHCEGTGMQSKKTKLLQYKKFRLSNTVIRLKAL
ncbi:hypothetical protein ShirakiTB12_39350 [Priestia megaterium]|uniref:Molecular chaperone DnaJ n=1 Tax=Priestia megaterium TaxID=1404 RepID=A0AAX6BP21_PRIMG|nr:hypothetical protein ShirakiTB12_39350 [Priestia megaterium]